LQNFNAVSKVPLGNDLTFSRPAVNHKESSTGSNKTSAIQITPPTYENDSAKFERISKSDKVLPTLSFIFD